MPSVSSALRNLSGSFVVLALSTVGIQGLLQLIGFAVGILIVRGTEKSEYALFTLAISVIGALSAISDSGIGGSASAQSGRSWVNREKAGSIIRSALVEKNKLTFWAMLLSAPVLCIGLRVQGLQWSDTTALLICTFLVTASLVSTPILEIPLKHAQQVRMLLWWRLKSTLLRCALLCVSLKVSPTTVALLLATAAAQFISAIQLRKSASGLCPIDRHGCADAASEIHRAIRRSLPGTLYFSVHSQASLWIIAATGQAGAVADLGALGRLAAVTSLFVISFETLVSPRFSQIHPHQTRAYFYAIIGVTLIGAGGGVCLVWLYTVEFLSLLGDSYKVLIIELRLLSIAVGIGIAASFALSLSVSRSFVPKWYVYVLSGIVSYLIFALIFGLADVRAVICVQLGCAVCALLVNIGVFYYYSRRSSVFGYGEG